MLAYLLRMIPEEKAQRPYSYMYEPYTLPDSLPFYLGRKQTIQNFPIQQMHSHNIPEIGYCISGTGIFAVGSKLLPFREGDVSFVSPKEVHFARSHEPKGSVWQFIFTDINKIITRRLPEWWDFDASAISGHGFMNVFSKKRFPEVCSVVHSLITEATKPDQYFAESIFGLLVHLAVQLRRLYSAEDGDCEDLHPRTISRILPAVQYIGKNYQEKIDIDVLADICNMSHRNFSRVFYDTFHKSAQDYITNLRIATICNKLKNSDDSITFIALNNGFFSISCFNRTFKEKTGMSPRYWRNTE
jgi:AraC-like DNA-binding protein/quercetin dioxygenase-like cupin family protein